MSSTFANLIPIENPKEDSYKRTSYYYLLPTEMKVKLTELSQDHQSSVFMTLLAAFQVLLYRYTGQKDIVVGSPIANRNHKEIENLIGFFVNTLALRTTLQGKESFLEVLNQVKETTLQAYQHQDVPFEQLVDHLNIPRALNRNPLFQIMFSFRNASEDQALNLDGLETKTFASLYPISKFDLSVEVYEDQGTLGLEIDYTTDLFEEATIHRMARHFEELVKSILKDIHQPIHALSLLTSQEQEQILVEWNDTKVDYPKDKILHELFEEQVKKTPHNIALVYEDEELTYQELNERANQLAYYLRDHGVGPDTLVAIALERSLEMMIGLLGILKAGGAYVPLDPTYPQERLRFMLEDTQAPVVLTTSIIADELPSTGNQLICLDEEAVRLERQPKSNPIPLASPHHLAYVIYTSGSTGKPKGVMIKQSNLTHYLNYSLKNYTISQGEALFHSSAAFDMSITSIFLPLITGQMIRILPDHAKVDDLSNFLTNNNTFGFIKLTPAHLKALKGNLELIPFKQQKKVLVIGGENLLKEDIDFWLTASPTSSIFNEYGPTETTVGCCVFSLEDVSNSYSSVSIGKPIFNTQMYILDSHLNAVPVGISGEIYIGGVGLARGYLNRPDLTADRFIPNPFITDKDAQNHENLRLYRTGDLARYLPDGNIEFLGRIDEQVKIRGFRIELGEIEATLTSHAKVSQAVLMAREEEGRRHLVAYLVLQENNFEDLVSESSFTLSSGEQASILTGASLAGFSEDLRNYLSQSLPDYMIPSFFIFMDKIPLTQNGKIDRNALPTPDASVRNLQNEYVAPRSPLESELAQIWSEVLKIEKVSTHDNFFSIGGDSIISIQIVSKARAKGIYFNVRDIFNHPTIIALALIAQNQEVEVVFKPDSGLTEGDVPLTPIQHWFFKSNLQNRNHFNQAVLLETNAKLNSSFLNKTFNLLVSHHDALRFKYHYETQEWRQTSSKNITPLSIQEIDLSHILSASELTKALEEKSSLIQQSFNIEKGPLIQMALFNCGKANPQRLLIVVHHLVIDGVSWRILFDDLEKIYSDLSEGKVVTLPSKTHSYQQWAKSLKDYASSSSLKNELPYWQKIVDSTKLLPVDFNNGPATNEFSSEIIVSLTEDETTQLLKNVPKAYHTEINDILLTSLVLTLGDWTQDYSLTLSLEGHGREDIVKDIDLSKTIGWFTSIFPVHLKIVNPQDLGESIKTIKEELRKIPHKGIGYGILAYLTQDLSFPMVSHPSMSFNYLGQWDNTFMQKNLFTFSKESCGESISDQNERSHLLDIDGEVKEGVLTLSFTYSNNHYHKQTIDKLAHNFTIRLREIIQHCCQGNIFGYTSSDFDLINLNLIEDELRAMNIGN